MEGNVILALMAMEPHDYTWTQDPEDLREEIEAADGLEVAGVTDIDGEACERCDTAEDADFFSVYVHYGHDPKAERFGASCIADRNTYDEAMAFAKELSEAHGLRILDCT